MMDDLSVSRPRLERALRELSIVNRWLGGYHATAMALAPFFRAATGPLRILDVGTGIADHAVQMVRLGHRKEADVRVEAIDVNTTTVDIARSYVATSDPRIAEAIHISQADAMRLPFAEKSFHVAHAALFLHHFADAEAVRILRELARVSRRIIINDLHRHPLSYLFVRMLGHLPSFGDVFSHDGPVSVLRSFKRPELTRLFERAGLDADIRWHPGFRWVAVADCSDH